MGKQRGESLSSKNKCGLWRLTSLEREILEKRKRGNPIVCKTREEKNGRIKLKSGKVP